MSGVCYLWWMETDLNERFQIIANRLKSNQKMSRLGSVFGSLLTVATSYF